MKKTVRILAFGVLTWLIPFALSFLFFTKEGTMTVSRELFKSIMVVSGIVTGMLFTCLYFKKISGKFCFNGILIGLVWLIMNWGLDILILLPMSKMALPAYFYDIGLGYLSIPVITIGVGCLLAKKM